MKLPELKKRVYNAWECLSTFNGAVVQPENFQPDVRQYGDLRLRSTWKKALAAFLARNIFDANLDNYNLIIWYFDYTPDDWEYEFRYKILEEFLMIPGGLGCIINGLEQIFKYNDPEDKEKANELLKMVAEQPTRIGSLSTGLIRELTGSYAS